MNKKNTLLLFLCLFCLWAVAQEKKPVKIACVGNSITYGSGIKNQFQNSYPGLLSQLLGEGYDVRNFGISARVMLNKGDHPYMHEQKFRDLLAFQPDIVTIKLGTNDSKPWNWHYGKDFGKDLTEMLDILQDLPSKPKIYLCFPVPAVKRNFGINDSVITNGIIPVIRRVAKKRHLPVVDLYALLKPHPDYYTDGIHPNEQGAALIAGELYRTLTGNEAPKIVTEQPFPGKKSQWEGFDRYDFICNARKATVVVPRKVAEGHPWIWRPAFFGAFPSVDKALLEKGFHVVYYDLTHLYGSPRAQRLGTDFYDIMRRYYRLSSKVTLEGFSRGGLFAFNWGAKNPDKVACIYVDAPVCDVFSWPGRHRELWSGLLAEWGLTDEQMNNFKGNPIDNLEPLADAGIPVISVCGDSDRTVPYEENMKIVADRYRALGGLVEIILKPGCDHHPHSLENPEAVVDFIVRNQPDYQKKHVIHQRANLANSYLKFTKEKKGCVAFLGGSITEMRGWRNMIQEDLKQRFPETEFTFIDAGIPSTGSTPHAFRFENDVLQKGMPDLLFVEAAVNDDTNGFDYIRQTRGMEGIIRHARTVSPEMDIVMLHFIYDPFIPLLDKGIQPQVIMNHESVANHYYVSSINLAEEVAQRMRDGEFDWKEFGGTHPAWNGHTYYAAAINRLFDLEWSGDVVKKTVRAHEVPEKPIDSYSYDKGVFADIRSAKQLNGWKVVDDWTPTVKGNTRKGFVHVPMLVADRAGASLSFSFEGRAVGIFCAAGPQACVLEYSVDGAPFKKLDTFTDWSRNLYIPWVYMLETELVSGRHTLRLRIAKGERTGCQIRNFVVNQ